MTVIPGVWLRCVAHTMARVGQKGGAECGQLERVARRHQPEEGVLVVMIALLVATLGGADPAQAVCTVETYAFIMRPNVESGRGVLTTSPVRTDIAVDATPGCPSADFV